MFYILQNFTGPFLALKAITEPLHTQYALAHGYTLISAQVEAPAGLKPQWAKIPCILSWMGIAQPNEVAVWLDGDTFIKANQPLDSVLGAYADLGMTLVEVSNGEYYNNGVMFIRNNPKCFDFFTQVLAAGPFAKQSDGYLGCPYLGDQGRMNSMLKASGLSVLDLDCKYNSYIVNPCKAPVISAWHGTPVSQVAKEMGKII